MTIHFEITPAMTEFICHALAGLFYMISGVVIGESPAGLFSLAIAIILASIGAHL